MEFLSPQLGLDMEELEEIEEDAGLGNGGLGRLAGEKVSTEDIYEIKVGWKKLKKNALFFLLFFLHQNIVYIAALRHDYLQAMLAVLHNINLHFYSTYEPTLTPQHHKN